MGRQDNSSLGPDFGAFDDLRARQPTWLQRLTQQRGDVVVLASVTEWLLIDLAKDALQATNLSATIRLWLCVGLALLVVMVFGLAARIIKASMDNATNEKSTKRSTQPRHQSGDP